MVSIVILNFNGANYTENCLRSLLQTMYPQFEIILIDNASTDRSFENISKLFGFNSSLILIKNQLNLGFAGGNNLGAKIAKGKYVVFLNNDTEVCSDWLTELVKVMESDPSIGAAQSKLLLFDKKTFDSSGDMVTVFGESFCRGKFEKDEGQYNKVEEVFAARGATMIVRRDLFCEVGGFDEKFFLTCEDTDLSWRMRLAGSKIFYVPTSVVYHAVSASSKNSFQKINHSAKNKIMMIIKNYSLGSLVICLPFTAISDCLFLLASLVSLDKRPVALSTCRAIFWLVIHFKSIWQERLRVQNLTRKIPDEDLKKFMIHVSFLPFLVRWFFRNHQPYRNNFCAFINSQLSISKFAKDKSNDNI